MIPVRFMDDTEMKIIKAIDTVSPKSFISPVEVNKVLMLDANQLGTRLMLLKKSGHVDIMISDYPSSLTLPNVISKVYLTELGRRTLKEIR
jgi:hypothetical protein